eukprot:CAMPEP_0175517424 /NCGR_PEP_ID=MMETSP0096-20121207/14954_1 /TAXON_ID=311494 /ORGANISM="Alexandrium monilatum, Strain CCMP3105" /LENGTH=271 /DNA_ID=CAMNT_0016819745 /DNA_START=32 /DNA_END=842 /DNA_ORIENTATION=-
MRPRGTKAAVRRQPRDPLPPAPEELALTCRFNFVLVGPRAHLLVKAACGTQAERAPGPVEVASDASLYCMVDEAPSRKDQAPGDVLHITFQVVEGRFEPLPSLVDESSVRSTCYVFVADSRLSFGSKVIPHLSQKLSETFALHSRLCSQSADFESSAALRAVLLAHPLDGQKLEQKEDEDEADEETEAECFAQLAQMVADSEGLEDAWHEVNFEDGEALRNCFRDIALQMYSSGRTSPPSAPTDGSGPPAVLHSAVTARGGGGLARGLVHV